MFGKEIFGILIFSGAVDADGGELFDDDNKKKVSLVLGG